MSEYYEWSPLYFRYWEETTRTFIYEGDKMKASQNHLYLCRKIDIYIFVKRHIRIYE
jgi:hypothetical protein